jgi:ABC-type uncharacterized transport system fused permease/ATPase subunit
VSVGHRNSLMAFHERVLELLPEGQWRFMTSEQARSRAA